MKRLVGYGVGLLVVVLLMFVPALFTGGSGSDASGETATITSYDAAFTVDEDGTLHAKETLKVTFPLYKHGIFRFFDTDAGYDAHVRLVPRTSRSPATARPTTSSLTKEGSGRYVVARIGKDVTARSRASTPT